MTSRRMLDAAFAISMCFACGDGTASRSVTELSGSTGPGHSAEQDHELADAIPKDATLPQVVELMAKKYAADFSADGEPITSTLAQGGRNDHLTVLRAGHCYRIVGAGGAGVQDMDLFLYDPEGVQVQQDPGQDRYPALGVQSEVCPPLGGAYRLQVHMYEGGGPYAVRVYRTP